MSFWEDAWDTIKEAGTKYAQYANAIYTVPAGYIAQNTNSPMIKQGAGIFSSSFAGQNSWGITPTMISGSNADIRAEKFRQLQGAAIGGGFAYAGAAGSALALNATQGKIDSGGILATLGVDPEVASLFPSLDLNSGGGGARVNPEPGSGGKRAPASPLPQLGGDSNEIMLPLMIAGGAAVIGLLIFGRR